MSKTVEERILEMRFDNTNFEKNAAQSIGTLDRLDKSLQLKEGTTGLTSVESLLSVVSDKFSILGTIADQAIRNITNSIMGLLGKVPQLIKSLSVDQIAAGWSKYAEKTTAVQTIMSATANDWKTTADTMERTSYLMENGFANPEYARSLADAYYRVSSGLGKVNVEAKNLGMSVKDFNALSEVLGDINYSGEQMEFVNTQVEKLNWFTDETSYSFLDMVNNIGKFTSNGVALNDAVTAMQGISTWAAKSGGGVNEASRAMYNLSQAIAVGSVKLQDWRSIESANMATKEFKETVLKAAVAEGTLKEVSEGTYKTLKGNLVTVEQFNSQLSDGWFSSKVLMRTLNQYGSFADKLQEVSNETDYTATELLIAIKKYQETGEVIPDLKGKIEALAGSEFDLGRSAFQAAQEAKTFQEAISSVKDAVSTGWMNTFETIFGNYEEAKVLWTDLANGMYEAFAEGGNERNRILKDWRNFEMAVKGPIEDYYDETGKLVHKGKTVILDGRKILMEGFYSLGSTVLTIISAIKEAFHDIFPPMTAETLIKLTVKFKQFALSLKPSEEALEKFKSILKGLFSAIDIGRMFIVSLYNVIKKNLSPIFKQVAGDIFDTASSFGEWITNLRDSIKENDTFTKALQNITNFIKPVVEWLGKARDAVTEFFESNKILQKIEDLWGKLKDRILHFGDLITKAVDKVKEILSGIFGGEGIGAGKAFGILGGALATINIGRFLELFTYPLKWITDLGQAIDDFFGTIEDAFYSLGKAISAHALRDIAISLLLFAAALAVLASIDSNKLGMALLAVSAGIGELVLSLKLLSGIKNLGTGIATKALTKIAISVLILAAALKIISDLDLKQIGVGLLGIAGIVAILVLAMGVMSALKIKAAVVRGVIQMALAVAILAGVIYIFSKMDPNTIGQGFLYMAGSLAALTIALAVLGTLASGGKMLAAGTAMLEMALAITILAAAIAIFGAIPQDKLIQGFVAFLAVLLFSVAALAVLSAMSAGVIVAAAALVLLGVAILAITAALVVLSLIPLDNLMQGLLAFITIILAMAAALVVLSPVALAAVAVGAALVLVAASIVIAAAGLIVLAIALQMLQGLEIMGLVDPLLALGLALVVLAVGCAAMTLGLIGAAALLVLGIALNTVAGIDLLYIAAGFALIGPAMILLAAGGVALGLASVGLLAGSLALAALGLALYPFALGLHQLDDVDQETILKFLEVLAISVAALAGLGLVAEAFAAGFTILGAACLSAGAGILAAGEGIKLIVDSILAIPDNATGKLKAMAKEMAAVLLDHGKEATNALEQVMKDLVKVVETNKPGFNDVSKAFAETFSNAFIEESKKSTSAINKMLSDCITTISSSVSKFNNASTNVAKAISTGISNGASWVTSSINTMLSYAVRAIEGQYYSFWNASYYIVNGIAQGIYNNQYIVDNAVDYMGNRMVNRFKSYNQIQSPSKLYAKWAAYIPEGAAKGVEDNVGYTTDAMEYMGDEMITAISPALAILSGILDGSFEFTPTVRPVVDMSDVYASANEANNLLGGTNNRSVVMAGSIAGSNSGINGYSGTTSNSSSVVNNTFNIYPPEGSNVDEIANAVERKLNMALRQRKAAGLS